jgi:chromate transporter
MRSILLSLLTLFVPLSLVSVGGGQTRVAEIHRQVVSNHHWLTENQFVDAFAISRMAPGPGTLLVTLIGWQVAGVAGAMREMAKASTN